MWSKRRVQSMAPSHVRADVERAVDDVHEPAVVVVDDVDDAAATEPADVVRLPARRRIERRRRQRHLEAIAGGACRR